MMAGLCIITVSFLIALILRGNVLHEELPAAAVLFGVSVGQQQKKMLQLPFARSVFIHFREMKKSLHLDYLTRFGVVCVWVNAFRLKLVIPFSILRLTFKNILRMSNSYPSIYNLVEIAKPSVKFYTMMKLQMDLVT